MAQTHVDYFHCIGRRDDNSKQLKMQTKFFSDDSIEVELVNLGYDQQRKSKIRKLFSVIFCYIVYKSLAALVLSTTPRNQPWLRILYVDFTFAVLLLYYIYSTIKLIKSEKLLFCSDFALQLQTESFLSRTSNIFIPSANIYDVCINEVIQDLDIHYILIIRTKGSLFDKKPIIPIFNTLRPSLECIELVYKSLTKVINNTEKPT